MFVHFGNSLTRDSFFLPFKHTHSPALSLTSFKPSTSPKEIMEDTTTPRGVRFTRDSCRYISKSKLVKLKLVELENFLIWEQGGHVQDILWIYVIIGSSSDRPCPVIWVWCLWRGPFQAHLPWKSEYVSTTFTFSQDLFKSWNVCVDPC